MTSGNGEPPGDDLDARLRAARQRVERETGAPDGGPALPQRQTGLAFRVGVELAAGLLVGGGIGWLLDSWLHTMPAMTIVFFILGAAAGIMNVYRTAMAINRAAEDEDRKAAGRDGGR
jgi:ATP synthase protein I